MAKEEKKGKTADKSENNQGVDTSKTAGRTSEQTLDQAIEKEALAVAAGEKTDGVVVESLAAYYKADPAMIADKLKAKVDPLKKIAEAAKARAEASEASRAAKAAAEVAAIAEAEAAGKVLVTVPKTFKLHVDNVTHEIKKGTYALRKDWAEHWYAKNNGVVIHQAEAPKA